MSLPRVVFGVDEAGRGPVIGPMVFGLAYCLENMMEDGTLKRAGVDDSKKLTPKKREGVLKTMESLPGLGYMVKVIDAKDIDREMLGLKPKTLNEISFDAVGWLITELFKKSRGAFTVVRGYFDAIGSKDTKYRNYLEKTIPALRPLAGPNLVIESKGDARYPVVGAASIAAKVTRDSVVEALPIDTDIGSGYPADPRTSSFLKVSSNCVFGFPCWIRFSWETIKRMKQDLRHCAWRHDRERLLPPVEVERPFEYSRLHLGHVVVF